MPSGELLQQAVRDLEQADLMDMFCPEYKHQYIIWRLGKFIMEVWDE